MGLRLASAGKQIGMSQGEILGFATALSSVGVEAMISRWVCLSGHDPDAN